MLDPDLFLPDPNCIIFTWHTPVDPQSRVVTLISMSFWQKLFALTNRKLPVSLYKKSCQNIPPGNPSIICYKEKHEKLAFLLKFRFLIIFQMFCIKLDFLEQEPVGAELLWVEPSLNGWSGSRYFNLEPKPKKKI